jgi:hypothetical protein
VTVSLMSVLESGFPPLGGSASPPNTLIRRRRNVLFPHPELAASPITTVLFAAAEQDTRLLLLTRMAVPAGEKGEVPTLVYTAKAADWSQ